MLLRREYYQTTFGERYLLLFPFAIHVTSSVAKRVIPSLAPNLSSPPSSGPSTSDSDTATQSEMPQIASSYPQADESSQHPDICRTLLCPHTCCYTLTLTYEVVAPAWSPSHVNSDTPDSFALEFEFVKTAINTSPLWSRILYMGLVGCMSQKLHPSFTPGMSGGA
ncbi:hypothetical protein EDD15DRAFT_1024848 [Pisolithus albus]|nr:hypothetical protein EDD15DRAFT_1024848 [Pisolithus albus]